MLPEVNERAEGVANWFKSVGDMDLKAPMEFPEGKYSVRDTLEELAKSPEAFEIAAEAIKLASNFKVKQGEGMWDMFRSMSPERMSGVMNMPDGFLESLNLKLTRIDK